MSSCAVGYGGLTEAGGKERKGKPSARRTRGVLTRPAPRWGTANLIRSARSPYPRETPQSEFRRLAVYPGNIPAEPDKPRQDPDGTGKKTLQNRCKIWSGRVRGASRIDLGRFRKAPERRKHQKTIFGAQKSTKHFCRTSPGAKKGVRRRPPKRFLSVFLAVAIWSRSPDQF